MNLAVRLLSFTKPFNCPGKSVLDIFTYFRSEKKTRDTLAIIIANILSVTPAPRFAVYRGLDGGLLLLAVVVGHG